MKVKFFNYWSTSRELELNFIGKVWNFRIGTHQIALWKNMYPVFNFNLQERACNCCVNVNECRY